MSRQVCCAEASWSETLQDSGPPVLSLDTPDFKGVFTFGTFRSLRSSSVLLVRLVWTKKESDTFVPAA